MKNASTSWTMDSEVRPAPSSSRILYDVPCAVCRDHSSGKHYGIFACDGCAGFFKRSVRRARQYACKARRGGCLVDKAHRNQCRACRLAKCLDAGMNKDAVQHERGPRNSTLRRQMALFLKEPIVLTVPGAGHPHAPHATPAAVPGEAACEAAARLLFLNVRWARQVGAFSALPLPDRTRLLEESWRELFALGAAHLLAPLAGCTEARALCAVVQGVARLQLDAHELACLRAIVLFQPAVHLPAATFEDTRAVTALHDHAHLVLNKYVAMAYPTKPLRFGSLLMLLPTLKLVSASTIEELFFRKTIGNIPIERIISDMYRSSDCEP